MLLKLLPILLFLMIPNTAFVQTPPIEPGISQELARWRAARYSDVRYKLNLTLEKMSPVLKGTVEIRVKVGMPTRARTLLSAPSQGDGIPPIILDWRKIRGSENLSTISNISLNGVNVSPQAAMGTGVSPLQEINEHLIFRDGVSAGENVIKLDFTSPILPSGSAITRYIDKEDGSEYIYSLFVPSDASTAFPVFDQPDLKSRFALQVSAPEDWKVVSNGVSDLTLLQDDQFYKEQEHSICNPVCPTGYKRPQLYGFTGYFETNPISTYVFAFAAGPWEKVSEPPALASGHKLGTGATSGTPAASTRRLPANWPPAHAGGSDIYVRKSQAAKFKPHAAEVFRLNREAIKYLEEYFDYKFPFPKYDLVLIPEFPFGGMEHAGATFLRESSVIFPQEPTANDYISRANLIFHEAAHQWFGDMVTMRWFDDLWLKEGFAEFMAYKTLEKVMPQYNAWKAFYERNKPLAYQTDSTRGTTPIYQPIPNLNSAKSAYGNIVYRKAPSFLKQAEFYLGPDKFQSAVRAFLKKHEFGNAGWEDLVREFEAASGKDLEQWSRTWVTQRGMPIVRLVQFKEPRYCFDQINSLGEGTGWPVRIQVLKSYSNDDRAISQIELNSKSVNPGKTLSTTFGGARAGNCLQTTQESRNVDFLFANSQDYGYGIFLLDDKSRDYVLKNIQNEKDDFLRSMMWGSLWDSVRETELDPREYVELAIKNLPGEKDETITASVLGRVTTAFNYYLSDSQQVAVIKPLEKLLTDQMLNGSTLGRRITFYRSFLNIGATISAREELKRILRGDFWPKPALIGGGIVVGETKAIPLKTKDKFDIVTRLAILGDPEAPKLLNDLEKAETSDDAKRYAYAAKAAFPTSETKEKFWSDFVSNKEISESWIEAAFVPFNSVRHAALTLPYLERALKELPNHKRNRKIFFVNGWLAAFIGGQKSEEALAVVNKFLADNPSLDRDLRLKILENVDVIERAVKIRSKFAG